LVSDAGIEDIRNVLGRERNELLMHLDESSANLE
jgi:hypothetical protein